MLTRAPWMIVVVSLFVLGGGSIVADTAPARAVAASRKPGFACHGIDRGEVRGLDPAYTNKRLASFRNHKRVCGGLWLPPPRRYLVPQGLALDGGAAWVSGFRYRAGYGQRPCQLRRVSLVTGRQLAYHGVVYGRVGARPRSYCRHGGGILKRGRYLWIVEKNKLWQVDPSGTHGALSARRVWRIKSPVRGSAIVATRTRIGLVPFETSGRPSIYWFRFKQLQRPRVLDLAVRARGGRQVGAVAHTRVPTYVQGATLGRGGGVFLARSTLSCGELVTPGGRRLGFVPGAEGLQFGPRGHRLYAVSESGARPYVKSRKPLTAAVTRFEWPGLARGRPSRCVFPGR